MVEPPKRSPSPRRSALGSGALTGIATVVLAGSAAAAGALLAHKFGRNARTDGFLAAYGVYIVLALAAQSLRLIVVPQLTRAAAAETLGAELRAYLTSVVMLAVPVSVVVAVLARPLGDALTGSLPHVAAAEASRALPWFVPAAFAQLLAALCAAALAARDSYGVAAAGYSIGGVAGFVLFAALADRSGIVALAWGVALNGALSLAVPLVALVRRGDWRGAPVPLRVGTRLWQIVSGAALPVALQGLYVIALRLAAGVGVGNVTSFSYAYLLAAMLVTATAFSLGVVSSAPLSRRGLDAQQAARHVVYSAWVALAIVAAAAGVFALVGGKLLSAVLGGAYSDVGRLVADLAPWMVVSVAFNVTFPLVFVVDRRRLLVPIAIGAVVVDVPVALALREAGGLTGIAISLAVTTFAVLVALMLAIAPRMLQPAVAGLARQALVVGGLAALSFGAFALLLEPVPAAVLGLAAYLLLLGLLRGHGLEDAVAYVRALH